MMRANLLPREPKTMATFGIRVDVERFRKTLSGLLVLATIVGGVMSIQLLRQHRLAGDAALVETLLAANDGPRRELASLAAEVAVLQRIERAARLAQHSGNDAAFAFASIGNAIPNSVWLDGIARQPDGYLISGSAPTLSAVGDTFDALSRAERPAHASLINVAQDAPRHALRFTIALNVDSAGAR
jgi:Tfp pilus assembly protein PilN